MADRVKYFVLGLLFLVVASVIAYDRWNTEPLGTGLDTSANAATIDAVPPAIDPKPRSDPRLEPKPDQQPLPQPEPRTDPKPETKPLPRPPSNPLPKPDTKPATRSTIHVVKSGETLGAIAVKHYGTRKAVSRIIAANPRIRDKDFIRVGDKLVIPQGKFTPTATPKIVVVSKIPSRYTVKKGDNLYKICARYYGSKGVNARVAEVMSVNHLYSASLKPGAVLVLPRK